MSTVTFPAVAGGATYTDDSDATTGLAAGGHKTRFIPALKAVVDTAADVVVKSEAAAASAALAQASAAYINGVAGGGTAAALAGSAAQDFAAKTLTATTVNANNIGEITHSQGIVTTYAASGSSGIQIANNDNLNFGTGDFTLVWKGSLPDWTLAASTALFYKYLAGYGVILTLDPSGYLKLGIGNGVSVTYYTATQPIVAADSTTHTVTASYVRETPTSAGSISFGLDGAVFSIVSVPVGAPVSVTTSATMYVTGYSTVRQAATTHACYAFNRALSADEVLSLYRYGVAGGDKWGSQTSLAAGTDSDFSGAGHWSNGGSAATVITAFDSGDAGYSSVLKMTAGDGSSERAELPQLYCQHIVGKLYRVKFMYKYTNNAALTSGLVTIANTSVGTLNTSATTWTEFVAAYIATDTTTAVRVYFTSIGIAGNEMLMDNFTIVQLGATLALEPEGIQPAPGQWLDSSTNKLHALQPATGSYLARKKENFEIRWTNTWAGTHEAQYVGGINQAVLPPNCYIESIIGVVSGTVIEDIILGDGVDTDRWVTITTGLATGTQTFAIANRVSDGTNRKLVVDPDANFTGSISWVIKGFTL